MEKKSKTKEIKMNTPKNPEPTQGVEKLTYEQLEQVAQNLSQQCQQMYQKLNEAERIISNFNDIGLLLSVIKQSEFFDDYFIKRCSDKIQTIITEMLDSTEKTEDKN